VASPAATSRSAVSDPSVSFLAHLQGVVSQVDGALACSVMGFDGIAVETFQDQSAADLDLTTTWVEYAAVLAQLKNAAPLLKTGGVAEVSVNTERLITVMRLVSPDYFVVLALRPDGNYGKGRYALRIAAPKIRDEL
jgi:predicted regulator of Ras-like GTPase activity (Roadblock/LC7/MglB family)